MYNNYPNFYSYEVLEYNRKSRADDPLLSVEEVLERHSKILDEYARKYLGGSLPAENKYKEVGSSETIDSRPEMLRLLKAIENPKIKAVLVVEVQRLSRGDLEDAGRLIKLLRYTNTYVITPMKIYDLRDDYDRDAFERELKRGNEYLEYFKKIQRRGRLESVKEGNYVGSVAPFGYDRLQIKDGKKSCYTLIEKKEEADIVRLIFEWYCNDDIGVNAICRRLEEMNVKTKTNRPYWTKSRIFSILENVHYIGYVRWNWRKTVKIVEDQEVVTKRPRANVDEYLMFKGKHEPIISEEIFNRAQEIKGQRHRTKTDTTLKNPFSGIVFCSCGRKMGLNTFIEKGVERAKPKLVCRDQIHCRSGSVEFGEFMEYVCKTLEDCIEDFELRIDNKQDDSVKLHKELITNLEKKLSDLQTKEDMQWDALYDPDPDKRMPQEVFNRLNARILKEKEEVQKALCKAHDSTPVVIDYADATLRFSNALNALRDPNVSAKVKNKYLREAIERIDYSRPEIIRITNKNRHLYPEVAKKGLQYHREPYEISIKIRS